MFEAYEELLEIWWFKHYAKGKSNDLFQFMCVGPHGRLDFLSKYWLHGNFLLCTCVWTVCSVSQRQCIRNFAFQCVVQMVLLGRDVVNAQVDETILAEVLENV